MNTAWLERFGAEVLIVDGAMGTQLAAAGLPAGVAAELWNVERPDEVLAVHRAYLAAGADIVLTNTFSGSRWALARHGLAERLAELNHAGALVARRAAIEQGPTRPRYVFGDIGPTGELMPPFGSHSVEEFEAVFAEQARALAGPDPQAPLVDAILIETMIAADECAAAVRAAKAVTGLPVAASMSFGFNPRRDGFFSPWGVSVGVFAAELAAAGADAIGVNCGTIDIAQMARLVAEMRAHTGKPILAEPNAGIPELREGRTCYHQTPDDFAAGGRALVDAGARIVGGCCGTTPAHIAALAKAVR